MIEVGFISIPYGAIKRDIVLKATQILAEISIPYGAIKRRFHKTTSIRPNYISIPYGAIKRLRKKLMTIFILQFQFLMVRLKVILF